MLVRRYEIPAGLDWADSLKWVKRGAGPIDLTGSTLAMRIATKPGATPIITLTTATGGLPIASDPTTGEFQIVLSKVQTALMTAKEYVGDLRRVVGANEYELIRVYFAPYAVT
jgi:hypothetical protein